MFCSYQVEQILPGFELVESDSRNVKRELYHYATQKTRKTKAAAHHTNCTQYVQKLPHQKTMLCIRSSVIRRQCGFGLEDVRWIIVQHTKPVVIQELNINRQLSFSQLLTLLTYCSVKSYHICSFFRIRHSNKTHQWPLHTPPQQLGDCVKPAIIFLRKDYQQNITVIHVTCGGV